MLWLATLTACHTVPIEPGVPRWDDPSPAPAGSAVVTERFPQALAPVADLFVVYDPALAGDVSDALPRAMDLLDGIDARIEAHEASDLLATASELLLEARPDAQVHLLLVATEDVSTADGWIAPVDGLGVTVVAPDDAEALAALALRHGGEHHDEVALGVEVAAAGASGLRRAWPLAGLPVVETVEVSVLLPEGVSLPLERDAEWTWDARRNAIVFGEYLPGPGATVVVTYEER